MSNHNKSGSNKYSSRTTRGMLGYLTPGTSEQKPNSSMKETLAICCLSLFILEVRYFIKKSLFLQVWPSRLCRKVVSAPGYRCCIQETIAVLSVSGHIPFQQALAKYLVCVLASSDQNEESSATKGSDCTRVFP